MKHDWEYKKLGEVCEVLDSKRKPVTKKYRKQGQYPYYGAMGIQDYVDNYIFDGDYLLVGEDGAKWGANDKSAYQAHGKCWVNNHAHILKVNENISNCKFIEHYLVGKDLSSYITGAVVPKLTQASLISIPIPVPPLPIQEQIVSELDKVSEIIEKKKQQVKELDNLAQSIFYDMFGDPVENEKGWEVKRLEEVCLLKAGKSIKANELLPQSNGTFPCYGGNGVRGYLKRYSHSEPYPIIGRQGALCGNVNYPEAPFYATEHAVVVIPKTDMNNCWLFYQLVAMRLNKYAHGVAQPGLSVQDIEPLPIPLPSLPLQQSFAQKIEAIEKQKELITASIKEAQTLFDARMDYWFGE